jgi:hypothetical protein
MDSRPPQSRPGDGIVELRALSDREWRISDTRIPMGDAGSVLGFVERVDDRFQLLELGHGRGIARRDFSSLDEVVSYFEHRS